MRRATLGLAAALAAAGCAGDDGPPMYRVSGTVTLAGKPVEFGDIFLVPPGTGAGADAGRIAHGEFSFLARPGPKTVRIGAPRAVPGRTQPGPSGNPVPVYEESVPARYNVKSELTAEVVPGGPNRFAFDLRP